MPLGHIGLDGHIDIDDTKAYMIEYIYGFILNPIILLYLLIAGALVKGTFFE
jgi:hypothetical protein